ncbi:uncharacterized protein BcabD6B2_07250 [Babesia caballi]|uniref:Uncharacterized protein n=1 Tax=Babesia caballi TaxID=5871 RepID=A0AAV4LP69_BABCB|nr:hypothetical protein BcabD6B2_07250 [Babesia caballi]
MDPNVRPDRRQVRRQGAVQLLLQRAALEPARGAPVARKRVPREEPQQPKQVRHLGGGRVCAVGQLDRPHPTRRGGLRGPQLAANRGVVVREVNSGRRLRVRLGHLVAAVERQHPAAAGGQKAGPTETRSGGATAAPAPPAPPGDGSASPPPRGSAPRGTPGPRRRLWSRCRCRARPPPSAAHYRDHRIRNSPAAGTGTARRSPPPLPWRADRSSRACAGALPGKLPTQHSATNPERSPCPAPTAVPGSRGTGSAVSRLPSRGPRRTPAGWPPSGGCPRADPPPARRLHHVVVRHHERQLAALVLVLHGWVDAADVVSDVEVPARLQAVSTFNQPTIAHSSLHALKPPDVCVATYLDSCDGSLHGGSAQRRRLPGCGRRHEAGMSSTTASRQHARAHCGGHEQPQSEP